MANNPELLKMPLARDGQKSTIPETTDASTGLFSQQYGWQSINSLPPQAGGKAVKREDFNGAFNLLGGVAFMAQKGFTFKWSAEQDYYAGCVVIDDTDGLRYECIADVTANNTAPSADSTHWQTFSAGTDIDAWFRQASTVYAVGDMRCYASLPYGWYLECTTAGTTGSGDITIPSPLTEKDTVTDGTVTWTIRKIGSEDVMPIGGILPFAGNGAVPAGYLLCDGAAVSRTVYPDLFSVIGTTYGAGDGSTTFNLPDLTDKFIEGSAAAGTEKEAGLPNITGWVQSLTYARATFGGCFQSDGRYGSYGEGNLPAIRFTMDASRSSAVYGKADTVQPPALTARYIIKAFNGQTADSALIDITQYANELAGKANRRLSNLDTANLACHVVVDSYYDSTRDDWWRKYDDGWIEQGGKFPTNNNPFKTITFLKAFATINYTVLFSLSTSKYSTNVLTQTQTQTTMDVRVVNGSNGALGDGSTVTWYACGMGAQS